MKKTLVTAVLLGALSIAHALEKNAPSSSANSGREQRWHEDLDFLARELPSRHKDFNKLISKRKFDKQISEVWREIPHLSDCEVVLRLQRLVARMGITHTHVGWPPGGPAFHPYPMVFFWYSEGLGVLAAAPEYNEIIGARVVRIGSRTPRQIEAALAPYIAHENMAGLHAESPAYLRLAEVLQHLKVAGADGGAEFSFIKRDGQRVTLHLDPSKAERPVRMTIAWKALNQPTPLCHQHPGRLYWYEFLPEAKVLYLQYRACSNASGYPFEQFVREVMTFVESNRIERVVVDLRNNGGGDSRVVKPLITALKKHRASTSRNQLYALIGRGTYSSGLWAALELRKELGAILVGEPTGGKPNGYGNSPYFTLPNSRLQVWYSTDYFRLMPEADPPSLMPDIEVPLSLKDFLAGRDLALEAALHGVP